MADRKASVALELKAGQFKAEAESVEGKIREVDRQVDRLDKDITKIPSDAARAGAAMKLLGGDVDNLGKNLHQIGDRSTALNVLDSRIRNSRSEVRKLTEEFVKTGDVDVFSRLGKASGELKGLTDLRGRITKELKGGLEDGAKQGAGTFASVFQGGIVEAFRSLPSEAKVGIIATLVGVVAAAAPLLGATINAGILAGFAGGGLAAGIALAAQDPAVQQAWSGVGKAILGRLQESARPFRAELIDTASIFGSAFHRIAPELDSIFGKLASKVTPLANGLVRLVENALPGIGKALDAAGPILDAIAENLPVMGRALDEFFSSLAAGGPGAAAALKFVLISIEAITVAFGWLIEALSKTFEGFDKAARAAANFFGVDTEKPKAFARLLHEAKDGANGLSGALGDMTSQVKIANDAFDRLFGVMMNIDEANLRVKEGMADLAKTARDTGATHDEVTGKVLNQIRALEDQRNAQLASGDGSAAATARINANYQAQLEQLKRMFPWLNALINKYEDLARPLTKTITVKVVEQGGPIPGGTRGAFAMAHGGIRKAAEGLLVPPRDPGTVLFGEPQTGGEALIPLRGISPKRAMGLAQTVGNNYGFDVVGRGGGSSWSGKITMQITGAGEYGQLLARTLQKLQQNGQLQLGAT
ncbi:MAG TPA: hypothetical protein VGP91_11840 [Actinoplanes sp.]|nr:hypothetical protein [Actinoplanes sp.]